MTKKKENGILQIRKNERGVTAIEPVDVERVTDIILYCLTPTGWKTVLKWTYSLENANKQNSHSMKGNCSSPGPTKETESICKSVATKKISHSDSFTV